MKTRTKWIVALAGVLLLSASIGRAIVARQAQQKDLAQSTASTQAKAVVLSARDVVTASALPLQRSLPVSGSLTAQRSAIVKAKVAAELLQLTVREGDAVSAGQVIGRLDPQEFETRLRQAQQQAAAARAQWQLARQNLDNSQMLVKQGFVSRNALDTAESNASSAKANYEAAQSAAELAAKALKDGVVRSPIAGLVSQRFVQVGERVGVDARIVEVVDLATLELQAPLSPADVLQVKVGTPASLRVEGLAQPLAAKVARINPSASPDTRSVMVYLSLADHAGLRQGLFVQGHILLGSQEALVVPVSAIARDGEQDHVLRVPGGTAQSGREVQVEKVAVQLGPRGTVAPHTVTHDAVADGAAETSGAAKNAAPVEMIAVLSGLQAGDVVLRHGSGTVREGQLVKLGEVATTAGTAPAASAATR